MNKPADQTPAQLSEGIEILHGVSFSSPDQPLTISVFRANALRTDAIAAIQFIRDYEQAVRHSDFSAAVQLGPAAIIAAAQTDAFDANLEASQKLCLAYKTFFIFIRALHDAIYACLLEKWPGQMGGKLTSLSDAFKGLKEKPAAALIRARIPEFEVWFMQFRDDRNNIKYGRGSGVLEDGATIRATFTRQTFGSQTIEVVVGHREVVVAAEMTAMLASLLSEQTAMRHPAIDRSR